jgi:predicted nucleic acid-binding protein
MKKQKKSLHDKFYFVILLTLLQRYTLRGKGVSHTLPVYTQIQIRFGRFRKMNYLCNSIHVACAIDGRCRHFITVDRRLLKYRDKRLTICNPVEFINDIEI